MGREVRRVPANWVPPVDSRGRQQPHYDKSYNEAVAEWKREYEDWKVNPQSDCEYWEWAGNPPDPEYYRPEWTDAERTHLMMYETCSEGTAISPAFERPEDLAKWLADTGASAFGDMTATYDQWLATIMRGYAPSAIFDARGLISGVEATATM